MAFAVKASVPIYLRREIYQETLCQVLDADGAGEESKVGMRVDESQVSPPPAALLLTRPRGS